MASRAPVSRSTTVATPTTVAPASRTARHGGEHRGAGRGGVLDDEHPPARDVRALDQPLHAVLLGRLAHDERVDRRRVALLGRRGVQDRVGHRVGAQGEAADGGVVPVGRQHPQQPPDQRRGAVVERDAAQVDVVVGLGARRQRDPLVHHAELADQRGQLPRGRRPTAVMRLRSNRRRCPRSSGRGSTSTAATIALYCRLGTDTTFPFARSARHSVDDPVRVEPQRAGARARRRSRPARGTRCARTRGTAPSPGRRCRAARRRGPR